MKIKYLILGATLLGNQVYAVETHEPEQYLDCLIGPSQTVELGSPAPGIIDTILVDRSDLVKQGQAVAKLESSVEIVTYRQAKERAKMDGAIKARNADLKLARQNKHRMEELYNRKLVPSQKLDEANAEYEVSLRNLQVAKDNQRLAQLDLDKAAAALARRTIRSPFNGIVVNRLTMPGEYVDERPVLSLAKIDPLRVEMLMPASQFGSVQPGMQAKVLPEFANDQPLSATVTTVDRLIDAASGTFRVRLTLPNPDHKIPSGLKCAVSFVAKPEPTDGIAEATPTEQTAANASGEASSKPVIHSAENTTNTSKQKAHKKQPQVAEIKSAAPWCGTLGPLKDLALATKITAKLKHAGVQVSENTVKSRKVRDYLVRNIDNPTQTEQTARAMRAAGLNDVLVYRRDKNNKVIMLGAYNVRNNAEKRIQEIKNAGFDASILTRYNKAEDIKLNLSAQTRDVITAVIDKQLVKAFVLVEDSNGCPASAIVAQQMAHVKPWKN